MKQSNRILVVDDSGTNLFLLQRLLEDEGYDVIALEDPQEALDYLTDQSGIDLILLDIMMPGIDGFKFLEKISANEQLKTIPVIMVTAKNDRASQKKALEMGAVDYMAKPLDLNKLRNMVGSHLS
jgi:CheY-like chemotaxis protein